MSPLGSFPPVFSCTEGVLSLVRPCGRWHALQTKVWFSDHRKSDSVIIQSSWVSRILCFMQKTKLAPAEARLQLNCFNQLRSIGLSTFGSPLGSIWLCGILPEVVPSHFNTYVLDTDHTLYSLRSYLFFRYWDKTAFQLEALQGLMALEERDRLSVKGWKGTEGLRSGGMYTPWG